MFLSMLESKRPLCVANATISIYEFTYCAYIWILLEIGNRFIYFVVEDL